jgi:hypothetical protein
MLSDNMLSDDECLITYYLITCCYLITCYQITLCYVITCYHIFLLLKTLHTSRDTEIVNDTVHCTLQYQCCGFADPFIFLYLTVLLCHFLVGKSWYKIYIGSGSRKVGSGSIYELKSPGSVTVQTQYPVFRVTTAPGLLSKFSGAFRLGCNFYCTFFTLTPCTSSDKSTVFAPILDCMLAVY